MNVYQQVKEAVDEFQKKNKRVVVLVKEEAFGIVLCFDHKIAHTRTNVMFTDTELRSLKGDLKKIIMDVCQETKKILIAGQKTK